MSGTAKRIAELEAMLAAKDAVIAEKATRLDALGDETRHLERLAAALAERVARNAESSHFPPPGSGPGAR